MKVKNTMIVEYKKKQETMMEEERKKEKHWNTYKRKNRYT